MVLSLWGHPRYPAVPLLFGAVMAKSCACSATGMFSHAWLAVLRRVVAHGMFKVESSDLAGVYS
eukprot:15449520-Alexandrium_andersonii.AAC.1